MLSDAKWHLSKPFPAFFRGNNYDCLISLLFVLFTLNLQPNRVCKTICNVSYRSGWLIQFGRHLGPAVIPCTVRCLCISILILGFENPSSPFGDQAPDSTSRFRRLLQISHLTILKLRMHHILKESKWSIIRLWRNLLSPHSIPPTFESNDLTDFFLLETYSQV